MLLFWQLLAMVGSGLVFFHWVGLDQLASALQPLTTVVSILIAAVFVRLNRGFPTIDWKMLDAAKRSRLTKSLVAVAEDYARVLALGMLTLIAIVVLGQLPRTMVSEIWQKRIVTAMGVLLATLTYRMAYVVWRDLDIVRLQKEVVDQIAANEDADARKEAEAKRQTQLAADKIDAMKASRLKTEPTKVTAWQS